MNLKILFGIIIIISVLSAQVQAQFLYSDNGDGTCTITGYNGPNGAVTIPSIINGLTVTSIGSGNVEAAVFSYFGPTSVTIPNSVTRINAWAFLQCEMLTGITIPASVVVISSGAFSQCTSLSSVLIIGSGTVIGQGAFGDCTSLSNVYFLGNAPTADPNAFYVYGNNAVTLYYLPDTTGWSNPFDGVPAALLNGPAPVIIAQPQSVVVHAQDAASFIAAASDILPPNYQLPLNYQWLLNGSNISGATSSSLTISNVMQTNLGSYSVLVSNALGFTNSSMATLSMYPFLATPFSGLDTYWGQSNTLSVGAWGTGPLSYQWFDNGNAIDGATNSALTLPSIQFTNAGLYSVVVSSALGSVTNTPYQVVVNPANVSLQLNPAVVIQGTVGYNYIIQSTTNLADTNSWATQTNLTLTQPVQFWDDTNTDVNQPSNPRKFYRVLPGQ